MDISELLKKYSQVYIPGSIADFHSKPGVIFQERCKEQLKTLPGITVFFGLDREPGAENVWMMNGLRVFQEPSVLYLTGINQTKVALVLNPLADEGEQITLFLPQKNPAREFWDGARLGLPEKENSTYDLNYKEITTLTQFHNVRDINDLNTFLQCALEQYKAQTLYSFFHEYPDCERKVTADHNWRMKENLKAALEGDVDIQSIAKEHYAFRLPQDEYQIKDAKIAQDLTEKAFRTLLREFKSFTNEHELSIRLESLLREKTPYGLAFPNIIASGQNACVLHYLKNDEDIAMGSMVLMDFGSRWCTQHADISRTVPINGKYNPLQKLLYNIAREAGELNESLTKPGALIKENDQKVWEYIEENLEKRFFNQGGKAKRDYEFKPHGVSHLMGEQEHDGDPFRLYQTEPLRPGMMLSNEPGIYGFFEIELDGVRYAEYIGIRIEDDLLVTEDGCENLSVNIPKTVEEIEMLLN